MSLKPTTTQLSTQIKTHIKIENGGINDSIAFGETLPEGLAIETVETVRKHDRDYTAAFTLASHELTLDAMKEDKELDQLTATTAMAGDTFTATINRSRTFPIPGKDEKKVVYGATTTNHTTQAGKLGGELKKVNTAAKEAFAVLAES